MGFIEVGLVAIQGNHEAQADITFNYMGTREYVVVSNPVDYTGNLGNQQIISNCMFCGLFE